MFKVKEKNHIFKKRKESHIQRKESHIQEDCRGTGFERRGLDMSDWRGVLGLWRRMTSRLSGGLPAAAAPAAGISTGGSSTEDSR